MTNGTIAELSHRGDGQNGVVEIHLDRRMAPLTRLNLSTSKGPTDPRTLLAMAPLVPRSKCQPFHWDRSGDPGALDSCRQYQSIPAAHRGLALPVENVSWDAITQTGGFLDLINESRLRQEMLAQLPAGGRVFRLPSETEWEYAARGGPHWGDGFRFSGSNDIDAVAWYDRRHGDHTQPVAQKAPNQLGLYDMSGNVWEWCQDLFTSNVAAIPRDGTPLVGPGDERVLRGGCFHNWAIHCSVSKRYQIERQYHDGCIGFRLVLSISNP